MQLLGETNPNQQKIEVVIIKIQTKPSETLQEKMNPVKHFMYLK